MLQKSLWQFESLDSELFLQSRISQKHEFNDNVFSNLFCRKKHNKLNNLKAELYFSFLQHSIKHSRFVYLQSAP